MDAYSSVGMPINYPHWSFGKKFIETERLYKHVSKDGL
ncbi:SpoVR family protein [Escherichia coli]|nr:SpoVR family protein [Escherichia coli]